jgi:hypothetical protein
MRAHTSSRARPRLSKKETAALVDEGARLHENILDGEQAMRETRVMLMEAGRPDLAQEFLSAPVALKDLAGFLWRNQPLVIFSTPTLQEPVSPAQYPKNFTLKRRSGENWCEMNENWYGQFGEHVLRM